MFFANDASSVHFSYRRYLENRLRDEFGFHGTPIKLIFRDRASVKLPRRRKSAVAGRSKAVVEQSLRERPEQPDEALTERSRT